MPLRSGEKWNITFFPTWKELGSVPAWRFLGTLRAALSIQAFWEYSVRVRSSGPGVGRLGGLRFGRSCSEEAAHHPLPFSQRGAGTRGLGTRGRGLQLGSILRNSRAVSAPGDPCPSRCPPGTWWLNPGVRQYRGAYSKEWVSGLSERSATLGNFRR